jgi:hypothetical protein
MCNVLTNKTHLGIRRRENEKHTYQQMNTSRKLQNQRALATQLKLSRPHHEPYAPVTRRYETHQSEEAIDIQEPDPTFVTDYITEIWPTWNTFSDFKKTILCGVVDFLLYDGHNIPLLIPYIANVVQGNCIDTISQSSQRGPLGEAQLISTIVTDVLSNAFPFNPPNPPTRLSRVTPHPTVDGMSTTRPRLSFQGHRVGAITDRTIPPPGDWSGRCNTKENKYHAQMISTDNAP